MQPRVLRPGARVTAFALLANLFLVPFVQAEEAELARVRQQITTMQARGAMGSSWLDQRKAMETLRQRVKDSRLDLDKNGIEFYRKKAGVMVDLERQRMRRAVKYLLDNKHGSRMSDELRKTGYGELVDLANNMQLATVNARSQAEITAQAQSVTDEYLSFRMRGYEQAVTTMETDQLRQVMVDTEEAAGDFIQSGGDLRTLNRGAFIQAEENDDGKSKIVRWLVGAIAGVGLIIAIFFSMSTMTITPFLTFVATVSGLVSLLGRNSAFQSVFFGNPYGPTPGPFNPYNPWNPYQGGFPPGGFRG